MRSTPFPSAFTFSMKRSKFLENCVPSANDVTARSVTSCANVGRMPNASAHTAIPARSRIRMKFPRVAPSEVLQHHFKLEITRVQHPGLCHLRLFDAPDGSIERRPRVVGVSGFAQARQCGGAVVPLRESGQKTHHLIEARAAALVRVAVTLHEIARRG